jgi:hypothetical protein
MKIPIYLSGAIRQELVGRSEYGYMRTPNMGNRPNPTVQWFADNGCFSSKGERIFHLDRYLDWLRGQPKVTCLGANAPDKVGDAEETMKRSLPVLPQIRELGYLASFVGQDGIEKLKIPWNEFDVFFIGGTTDWKLSEEAAAVSLASIERSKWLHMGRVNSYKRYLYAALLDCDSVDGTFLAFGPSKNLSRLERWIERVKSIRDSGEPYNENDLPVWWNQQTIGQRSDRLERSRQIPLSFQIPFLGPDAPGLPRT